MFESIKLLRPYFFSVREIKDTVSLDIKLPPEWEVDRITSNYEVEVKVQDKNEKSVLISLIAPATQDGYNKVNTCAIDVIKINIEMEEKAQLLENKIKELQVMFKNESLDTLKELKFGDTLENGHTIENAGGDQGGDGSEREENLSLAGETVNERPEGD